MLEQIGGECAGAVTFIPTGEKLPERNYSYRPLTGGKLAEILRLLPRRPLMAGEDGIRLSLAGAQDKIAVHIADDHISIPLGGAPSTHILKPAIERFEGIVFNEAFCMKLAHAIGLHTAKAEVGNPCAPSCASWLSASYGNTVIRQTNRKKQPRQYCNRRNCYAQIGLNKNKLKFCPS